MPRISKRSVDAMAPNPSGKRLYLWDSDIKGFSLLVLPSGVKSYFYRYRNQERLERRATIGKHGAWTPEQARRKAEELRHIVSAGGDPVREKRALKEAPTVAALLDAYVEGERFKSKSAWTQVSDRSRIAAHLKPLLGNRHVERLMPSVSSH
jgi:Arm DNA-binding domain